jgi:hypothetical protein
VVNKKSFDFFEVRFFKHEIQKLDKINEPEHASSSSVIFNQFIEIVQETISETNQNEGSLFQLSTEKCCNTLNQKK